MNGIGAGNVAAVLAEGNPDTAMKVFNRMFLALDYQRYPVRDEFACRGFLQALLMGARLYSQIEVPNAFGRSYLKTGNVSCTAAVMDINEGHETKKNAAANRGVFPFAQREIGRRLTCPSTS